MGQHNTHAVPGGDELRAYMRALLNDVQALEQMLENNQIETGIRRIGAEQEMFIVDKAMRPMPIAPKLLESIKDPRFTTELAQFNLEANMLPCELKGDGLKQLHNQLEDAYQIARTAAQEHSADVVLAGILPTLVFTDVNANNMTPDARYAALNEALRNERGGTDFHVLIKGTDELEITHESVMLEAFNTSYQLHLQVAPDEFALLYNAAQAVTAALVAVAANSPFLMGKRLWHETRLPLFERSVDSRSAAHQARGHRPRVSLGGGWIKKSVLELFQDDIARYRVLLAQDNPENALESLKRGKLPGLGALNLHNGTIWRWNRPCYGVKDNRAHIRIENRVLPSGPTIIDEVANAAFFFGLVLGVADKHGDVAKLMSFDAAKTNFAHAARYGMDAQIAWLGHAHQPVKYLVMDELLPLAHHGLKSGGVDTADADRYLGVIEQRVRHDQNGAQWYLNSFASMDDTVPKERRFFALTAGMAVNQQTGQPVHSWPLLDEEAVESDDPFSKTIDQVMMTDMLTVRSQDLIELATRVMDWEKIRYVPVEDDNGTLVGLVSHENIKRLSKPNTDTSAVESIMEPNPTTIGPTATVREALDTLKSHSAGCLLVVEGNRLMGMVTEDYLRRATQDQEDE